MFSVLNLFTDIISMIIFGAFLIWVFLFVAKLYYKKQQKKGGLKSVENVEKKLKKIGRTLLVFLVMFIKIILASLLAIGTKPLIYKLNQPFGWGYATFASYCVAICLYILLPDIIEFKEKKNDSI